eukprot:scaffold21681_cov27-Tisochrysis_lutea.AAC.5
MSGTGQRQKRNHVPASAGSVRRALLPKKEASDTCVTDGLGRDSVARQGGLPPSLERYGLSVAAC